MLGNLGIAYYALGEVRRELELYEQRLKVAREVGDRCGESTALGNLGNIYARLGEVQRALDYYEQGLAIAREIDDQHERRTEAGIWTSCWPNKATWFVRWY